MIPVTPSVRSDLGMAVTVGRSWISASAEIWQYRTLAILKRLMNFFFLLS